MTTKVFKIPVFSNIRALFSIEKINEKITLGILDLAEFGAKNSIHSKREREGRGIAFLLGELFPREQPELKYTEQRKPYLSSHKTRISIAHSYDLLTIICNETEETGIDVEMLRDKVKNIKHKFLNHKELTFVQDDVEKMITLWAAKEALYKAHGKKGLDFSRDMFVEEFSNEENEIKGGIECGEFNKKFLLRKERRKEYLLVYLLCEI